MTKQSNYQQILAKERETVVYEYPPVNYYDNTYQSEVQLEGEFINTLVNQGYQYLAHVKSKEDLVTNLRLQMEILNDYQFSNSE